MILVVGVFVVIMLLVLVGLDDRWLGRVEKRLVDQARGH